MGLRQLHRPISPSRHTLRLAVCTLEKAFDYLELYSSSFCTCYSHQDAGTLFPILNLSISPHFVVGLHVKMRLLRHTSEDDFELVAFTNNIPPYAILSHTWTNDEVSYNELAAGTGKNKAGYDKIRFCGERAAHDGLQYFWIDTCCIDKSTSDEISTAINSMFRWYQRASKCYVYLVDVQVSEEVTDAQLFQIAWEDAFRRSRWFTRGWTLQELLAPASVEFFSKEGKRLGSKISLEREVHEVTQIPVRALQGQRLSEFSVDERMSWNAKRRTTVEEDKAYCLLGIFGVFMPLIYGEGEEHAYTRLRRKLLKSSKEKEVRDSDYTSDLLGKSWVIPGQHLCITVGSFLFRLNHGALTLDDP